MLNCTDLACVLHHHHFYAHLHHLKHHLSDEQSESFRHESLSNYHQEVTPIGLEKTLEFISINKNAQINNETQSDLSSLSHLDAPNDVIFMICGVIIAMLLVGLIIVLVAVTINKIRKRDGSSPTPVHKEPQQAVIPNEQTSQVVYRQSQANVWVFPPLPPQPNLYSHNNETHDSSKIGLRGFKKQLSGKFKRLVSKKQDSSAAVIPPELKPQLKTIYVY